MMVYRWRLIFSLLVVLLAGAETGQDGGADRSRSRRAPRLNAHLRITSILIPPFLMLTPNGSQEQFEGFVPDLIRELSSSLGFTYNISLVKDGMWGLCRGTTNVKCYGMIGEVYRGEADLAAAPLVASSGRQRYVSFVWAFHQEGLTTVLKKDALKQDLSPVSFSVFRPLKAEVYGMVILAALVVGLVLWLMNRFNPYEWGGRPQTDETERAGAESFSLSGSLWFVLTSLQWQGFERAPRSLASKTLTFFWFVFVTITLVTYTGSLVNHMFWASSVEAVQSSRPPIRHMADIVKSGKYDYGCIAGGFTSRLLMDLAEGEMYDAMRKYWETPRGQKQFVQTTMAGIKRVRSQPNYAMIMESTMARYLVNQHPCDLTTVGGIEQPRSYAFAMAKNSQYRDQLHLGVMELQESGEIKRLMVKWWQHKGQCWNISSSEDTADGGWLESMQNEPKRVGLDNFWGPLVLVLAGVILSLLIALGEYVYSRYRTGYPSIGHPLTGSRDLDS